MTQIPEDPQNQVPLQPGQVPDQNNHSRQDPILSQGEYSYHGQPVALPKKKSRGKVFGFVAVATVAVVGVGLAVFLNVGKQTAMDMAFENCNTSQAFTRVLMDGVDEEWKKDTEAEATQEGAEEDALAPYFEDVLSLEDDGNTLIISTKNQDDDPLGFSSIVAECVYIDLGTPKWVHTSVQQTRALDGRQSAEWDNYKAQWSYHPDSGLNMIITSL